MELFLTASWRGLYSSWVRIEGLLPFISKKKTISILFIDIAQWSAFLPSSPISLIRKKFFFSIKRERLDSSSYSGYYFRIAAILARLLLFTASIILIKQSSRYKSSRWPWSPIWILLYLWRWSYWQYLALLDISHCPPELEVIFLP